MDSALPSGIVAARDAAIRCERIGYDGAWITETTTNPFVDLAVPAVQTRNLMLGTNVAIAFARSPFVTAQSAWQLQAASGGRFVLGLGTQVKGHIERRFGLGFDPPGPKLREYVGALKAIWRAFDGSEPLRFRGRFYNHTILTAFFNPGPSGQSHPPVMLAAVNEYNCETVGLSADGLLVHPLHTRAYLDRVVLPAVRRGLDKAGRSRDEITIAVPVFVACGGDDPAWHAAQDFVRSQIAFYASTRTYRPVLETHGWGDLSGKLHNLMGRGDVAAMSRQITGEMLAEMAITGDPEGLADAVAARYADIADRVYLYNVFTTPWDEDDDALAGVVAALRRA